MRWEKTWKKKILKQVINMAVKSSKLTYVIKMGLAEGKINEGLIALWTGLGPSATYLLFKQVKQLCESGKLVSDDIVCTIEGNEIIFKRKEKEESKNE
jgi:hypothetical protein